jgi:ActR/RegA family two-component response regulator
MTKAVGPDVVLLAPEWRPRALIRAQLIEEGLEVVATNTWAMMRRHLRPGIKPRLALIDLKGLPDPASVLNDVRVLMKPERVFVLTALGAMAADDVARLGFRVLARPIRIDDVVRAIAAFARPPSRGRPR